MSALGSINPFGSAKRRQAEQNAVFDEIDAILSSHPSIDALGDRLVEEIRKLIPFDRMSVRFVDFDKGTFTEAYVSGLDVSGRRRGDIIDLDGTLAKEAINTPTGVLVADESPTALVSRFPGLEPSLEAGIKAVLAFPLASADGSMGALMLASTDPKAYSEDYLELGRRVSSRIAGPIFSAKLRRDAEEATTLAEIGRSLSSATHLEKAYETFAGQVRRLVPFDQLAIALVDRDSREFTNAYVGGTGIPDWGLGATYETGSVIFHALVEARSGLFYAVDTPDELATTFPQWSFIASGGICSILAAPLNAGDEVVAALILCSTTPNAYAEMDLTFARRIAAQIEGPIANSRLHDELRHQTEEQQVLAEIGRISASAPAIDDVFDTLVDQVRRLVPFERMVVALVDVQSRELTNAGMAGLELPDWRVGKTVETDGAALQSLIDDRSGVVATASSAGEFNVRFPQWSFITSGGVTSIVAASLVTDGVVNAVLLLCSTRPNAYSQHELDLASRITSQIEGLLARSRLNAELRHEAEEQRILGEIGRLMSTSSDFGEVYEDLAEQVRGLIRSEQIVVAIVDAEHRTATNEYYSGTEIPGWGAGETFEIEGALFGAIVGSQRGAVAAANTAEELGYRFPEWSFIAKGGTRSVVATPLVSNGQVIAALILCSTAPSAFAERDLALAQRVTAEIAGPLASSRLRAELRQEAEEQSTLGEIGRLMSAARNIDVAYQDLTEQVRLLIPFEGITVELVDLREATSTIVYSDGTEIPDLRVGTTYDIDPAFQELVDSRSGVVAAEDTVEGLVAKLPERTFITSGGIRSFLVAPLISADEVIASLTLYTTMPNAFTEADLALAERHRISNRRPHRQRPAQQAPSRGGRGPWRDRSAGGVVADTRRRI